MSASLLCGCGLLPKFSFWKQAPPAPAPVAGWPVLSFEVVQDRAGGLQPADHLALARWDEQYYYFEWREIVEPSTMKTAEGYGRVPIAEFDRKNGRPLERKIGIIGKEDLNGQLYNAGEF